MKYTPEQVSDICGVYPTTVINWVKQKKLPAFATPGGHRRIRHEDLIAFIEKYNFPKPPELAGSRRKVLIVDDDASFAKLVQKAFNQHSDLFETQIVHNGIEALLGIGRDAPDLVLLDVVMPVVDGATVCSTLRSQKGTASIKVLAVTGKRLPPRTEKFIRARTDGLFKKPVDVDALVARASQILQVALPVK